MRILQTGLDKNLLLLKHLISSLVLGMQRILRCSLFPHGINKIITEQKNEIIFVSCLLSFKALNVCLLFST